jgi:uncharacterized Fe-S cluster-containing protein
MEEIEEAICDGSPTNDISKAMKDNAGKVKKVIDKLSGKAKEPECPVNVKDELKVHFVTNEMPHCSEWEIRSGELDWAIA